LCYRKNQPARSVVYDDIATIQTLSLTIQGGASQRHTDQDPV
jgi:hypothetical protein